MPSFERARPSPSPSKGFPGKRHLKWRIKKLVYFIVFFTLIFTLYFYYNFNETEDTYHSFRYKQPYFLINRHFGVSNDFHYLARQLNFTIYEQSKDQLFDHIKEIQDNDFLSEDETRLPQVVELANQICDNYDVVLVADINGDARFLLERIRQDPSTCNIKKLIFLATNRFDFHNRDVQGENKMDKFHELVRQVTFRQGSGPEIRWVTNNPYEIKYAELKLGKAVEFELIRPFGFSSVPPKILSDQDKNKTVLYGGFWLGVYYEELVHRQHIPVSKLEHDYGGPSTLAQYKAFVEFPYQVSTMKLYENIAAGVTMLIPSHRFFQELMDGKGPKGAWYWGFNIVDFNYKSMGSNWYEYVDYYHKDFQDYIYYFDSYQELSSLLQQPIIDTRNVKEKGPKLYDQIRRSSVASWTRVLNHAKHLDRA